MNVYIRSRLTSGLVVAGVSALIAAPTAPPQSTAPSAAPPVALAAQVQPLRQPAAQPLLTGSATPAVIQSLDPIIQQVNFNIAFVGDFLSTGAVLFGREFAIPGALLHDVQNGTPVPAALSGALQTFAQIELEAGRDLVGFAAEYVSFQLKFLTSVAAMPFAAVDAFAMSTLAGMTPASAAAASVVPGRLQAASTATKTAPHGSTTAATPANVTTTRPSGDSQATSSPAHTITLRPKTLRSVVPESESVTKMTTNGKSGVTHKRATDTGSTTSSTTGSAGQTDAGSQHQPHHDGGQPKGGGNKG
jgi:hypothetical protein